MTSKLYIVICILIFIPGCLDISQDKPKHTYFIQAPFNMTIISKIQEQITSKIDEIIEEDADVKRDKETPFFFFKKRAAITVYYVNDMYIDGEPFLLSSLKAMEQIPAPKNVSISPKVNFFGAPKEELLALTDLVVEINDPEKGLSLLNEETKQPVHNANEQYKSKYNTDMYDIAKSERFSYLPHLSLGHLRANYIKHQMSDKSKAEETIERIKQRILEVLSQALSELPPEDKKISLERLSIYDLQKRTYISEHALAS